MNKKHVWLSALFFFLGIVGGSVLNLILKQENSTLGWAITIGIFCGIVSSIAYNGILMWLGFEYDESNLEKVFAIILTMMSVVLLWSAITAFVSENNGIAHEYAWMHIAILIYSIIIVITAILEGNKIRKSNKM